MIKFLSRYQSEGLRYRCILTKDGKTRRSRWFETRGQAFNDAMFWHKFYSNPRYQEKE